MTFEVWVRGGELSAPFEHRSAAVALQPLGCDERAGHLALDADRFWLNDFAPHFGQTTSPSGVT